MGGKTTMKPRRRPGDAENHLLYSPCRPGANPSKIAGSPAVSGGRGVRRGPMASGKSAAASSLTPPVLI
jgi:hypothetical protein